MSSFYAYDPGNFTNVSISDICIEINKYSFGIVLFHISKYSWEFYDSKIMGNPKVNNISLSKLFSIVMAHHSFKSTTDMSINQFEELNQMVLTLDARDLSDKNELSTWMLTNIYYQFILNFQSPYYHIVLFISLFIGTTLLNIKPFKTEFELTFGINVQNYAFISWTFIAFFNKHRIIKNLNDIAYSDKHELAIYLKQKSKTPSEFKELLNTQKKYLIDSFGFNFSPLRDYPIVVIPENNEYIAPIPQFLFNLSTDTIYFNVFEYYFNEAKKNGMSDPGKNEFTNEFGVRLEQLLLEFAKSELRKKTIVIPEFSYGKESKKSADLHLVEKNGVVIIQSKGKRVILKSQLGDFESFKSDVKKSILYGVEQNYKLLNDQQFVDELNKKGNCQKITLSKKIITLVVSPESYWNLTIPPFKEYFDEENSKLKKEYKINENNLVFVISLEGIIRLFEWNKVDGKDISKILIDYQKYLKNPGKSNNLGSSGFAKSLDKYIKIKTNNLNTSNTLSKKIFDDFIIILNQKISNGA